MSLMEIISIYALAEDETHVYAGGDGDYKVKKYLKADMTLVDESPSYGGTIVALTVEL